MPRGLNKTGEELGSPCAGSCKKKAVIVPFAEPSMEVLQDIQTFSSMHENVQLLLMEQRTLEEGEALLKKVYDTQWFHGALLRCLRANTHRVAELACWM
eukprot:50847-Amphidinium_carterae.1